MRSIQRNDSQSPLKPAVPSGSRREAVKAAAAAYGIGQLGLVVGKGRPGNKDDRFDAFVLTDTLRTDRARLPPLVPDSPAIVALRQTCRAREDLVAHRVAVANQLRAHLQIVFPGAMSAEPPGESVRLWQSHDGQGITPLP